MRRIPWDKYEIALLVDKYMKVSTGQIKKAEAIVTLSKSLRKRAIDLGLKINEIFN